MQQITPQWLFERADISAFSTVQWGQKPTELGPGIYVITSEGDPSAQEIVYVGRSKHLRKRLGQFYGHKYGKPSPHRGGQAILNLSGKRMVHWAAVADYAGTEKIMLTAFRDVVGVWPVGNRMRASKLPISN